MFLIASRTAAGAGLLLIMPVVLWISDWQWHPGDNAWWLKALFGVSETVTKPWGMITHTLLYLWFLWCLRFRLLAAMMLFWIMATTILAGQGVKSLVRAQVQEPRPFVIWLEKTHHIPINVFYTLKLKERRALVKEQLAEQQQIPIFLRNHWPKETSFALPSGHTIFAASWTLFGVGLLWPCRRTVTIAILVIWTSAVMESRMLLGMHWPQDLIVAIIISWLLVTLATWLVQKLCGSLTLPAHEIAASKHKR